MQVIEAQRRLRLTAAEIAELLDLPLSTVSRWLKRIGSASARSLSRRSRPTDTSVVIRASSQRFP